jgi:hypothetical protein
MAKKTARKSTARKPSARRVMRDLLRDGGVRDVDTIVDGLAPFLRKAGTSPSPTIAPRKGNALVGTGVAGRAGQRRAPLFRLVLEDLD